MGWLGQNDDNQFIKSCALTVAVDGTEEGLIDCFKENHPCRAGFERLSVVQQAMSISGDKDHYEGITESDVEYACSDRYSL